jgi:RNA polymerase sigma-70 factor, ECF subfamily
MPMSMTTEQVWEAFHVPLLHFIRKHISDETMAEDILQDVFLKIHRNVETLKKVKNLESWVYRITRHAIIDHYRSKQAPMITLDTVEVLELSEDLPDDDIISELFPAVRAMVQSLPELDRQALVLTEFQGLSQKEYSERLGISFSGAKSRVQRARGKLKQQLLDCCHFELDRRGHVINYQPHCQRCLSEPETCCSDASIPPIPEEIA